ncbi:S9 family peptidase [Chitinophaga qingshengii]|uniref:Prolyl oligopeptidase family serine peptidase n=1 Tax=Chitinophaga qingshengii TaxID=1569794 RepID=A0ABR7TIM2_9BACT|nr:prolyl oligopeptidase family serine peptidase [Chitinophaga qingshengii]MBC9930352.1 prolyl oligopeptidase family serine peptidase [Chitinophaga qingshengii]
MTKWVLPAIIFLSANSLYAQQPGPLTVEKIMRDPKWIGTSPDNLFWGTDNQTIYFSWNPDQQLADSLYAAGIKNHTPVKTAAADRSLLAARSRGRYNADRTLLTYSYQGDVYLLELKSGKTIRITQTTAAETNPVFSFGDQQIVYEQNRDLFAWNRSTGLTTQLTSFTTGNKPAPEKDELEKGNEQEKYLKAQQLELLTIVRDKKTKKDASTAFNKQNEPKSLRKLYLGDKKLSYAQISPDGRYVDYHLFKEADGKNTIVPEFVTASGFTTDIHSREKVGAPQDTRESFIYDRERDTVLSVVLTDLPGIRDLPDYSKDYPGRDSAKVRTVSISGLSWSDKGTHAIADVRSDDNKDRWIVLVDLSSGKVKSLNRQRDEAWIAGPGIGWLTNTNLGWIDENTCWYQSEASGYSHLYTTQVVTGATTQLTKGNYEVQDVTLSNDKKHFYIVTNEVHPGEKQLYRIGVNGGKAERLTAMEGAHEVSISPDEKWIAYRYSYSTKPWELYLQPNSAGAKPVQITNLAQSAEFKAYPWRDPQVITFTARDNQQVYARLYTPDAAKKNGAAVIFVHGAGYLQNAHKWWSSYFREYMFHNLLTDKGYTVLDVDYRGSAGYGRNWRTGIYRYMGGKDLDDEVDAAKYLAEKLQVDASRIGIYGGSYGGFMTLMAMFTKPGVFAAGAALRSVTDWAHYNHGYTSNILNEPFTDSIAYRRSSPIYFAGGLKGRLLMCHGMVDTNVHFQDIVRLSQRLIELGKDNWELAVYPVEDHGFTTPSSWTDEYKRILHLFDNTLLK